MSPINHAIKTALATIVTTVIILALHLPKGYWAVISAVIVMHSNVETGILESTKKAAINRIIGTLIGAAIGFIFLCLNFHSLLVNIWIIFFLTIVLTFLASYYKFFSMAVITAIMIILVGMQSPEPWSIALLRALNIIIGVAVAIVITIYILPYRAEEHLHKKMADILTLLNNFFNELMQAFFSKATNSPLTNPKSTYIKLTTECRKTLADIHQNTHTCSNFTELLSLVRRIFIQLENIEEALPDAKNIIVENADLFPNINDLRQNISSEFSNLINVFASYPQKAALQETQYELQAYDASVQEQRTKLKNRPISTSLDEIYHFSTFLYGLKHLLNLLGEGKKILTTNDECS